MRRRFLSRRHRFYFPPVSNFSASEIRAKGRLRRGFLVGGGSPIYTYEGGQNATDLLFPIKISQPQEFICTARCVSPSTIGSLPADTSADVRFVTDIFVTVGELPEQGERWDPRGVVDSRAASQPLVLVISCFLNIEIGYNGVHNQRAPDLILITKESRQKGRRRLDAATWNSQRTGRE